MCTVELFAFDVVNRTLDCKLGWLADSYAGLDRMFGLDFDMFAKPVDMLEWLLLSFVVPLNMDCRWVR